MYKNEILSHFFAMHYVDQTLLHHPHYDNSEMLKRADNFIASFEYLRNHIHRDSTDEEITFHSYECVNETYTKDKLRDWFSDMNLILFDKPNGARLANFISIYGVDNFIDRVDNRINNYFLLFSL